MGDFWPVPDVLAYLAGSWEVDRTVRDLASGAEGTFSGTTVFGPLESGGHDGNPEGGLHHADDGLLHHESGTFVWQGTPRPAERTLRFLPGRPPGTALVQFSDGRPFHDLDLTSGHHAADHPCSADFYRGEFTVQGPDRWRTVWRVTGPAKDLFLVTEYTRR
ncbi:DUF6314 family protein [Streptomyces sp. NPDC002896]|uniref:DUF6314 family protein n=1 Tax=Streptomyces sp. NPDC002896 TaxID=3154438 RepID=UPI003328ED41